MTPRVNPSHAGGDHITAEAAVGREEREPSGYLLVLAGGREPSESPTMLEPSLMSAFLLECPLPVYIHSTFFVLTIKSSPHGNKC